MSRFFEAILQKWRVLRTIFFLCKYGGGDVLQDSLTGLDLRHTLNAVWRREVALSNRYGRPVSIVLFDLDDFKKVNDSQGHLAGDVVLKETARILKQECRGEDVIIRWGGDEFLVVLPNAEGEGAGELAKRVRLRLFLCGIGISFGIGSLHLEASEERRDAGALFEAVIRIADAELYLHKANKAQVNNPSFFLDNIVAFFLRWYNTNHEEPQ
ncbi:MAG: GGDEF domain-containing protein [bacterium]|nr:GGDEF domain-containing protein [bacterium]